MTRKKNCCPNCDTEIREENAHRIVKTYLAGRDLCADIKCGGCGHTINVSGTITAQFDHDQLD